MNLTRATEKPIEHRGESSPTPGSVKDWQSDRLALALVKVEQVFNQAIAEQQKADAVPSAAVVQLKATLADIQQAGSHDVKAAKELADSAERFLASAEVQQVLPRAIQEGRDTERLAGQVAQVANREFATSTFYGVSQDACSADVRLEAMCDRAHALVKAGYIGEKELEGVQVALTDPQAAKARAAESFASLAFSLGTSVSREPTEASRSQFIDDTAKLDPEGPHSTPKIYVDRDSSEKSTKFDPDASAKTFSHEIGHWLGRDKGPQMLAMGLESVKAAGGPEAAQIAAFYKEGDFTAAKMDMRTHAGGGLPTQELRSAQFEGVDISVSWTKTVKEMQGDLMSLAVENAVNGKDAALAEARTLIKERETERLDALALATESLAGGADPTRVRFAEEHHTTGAIREFAERIKAGDLDKVQTPQQLDKLMGESIVRGLVAEYTMVRGAELNIHHLENGKAVPGLPPGVDLKSVLVAEMGNPLRHEQGAPTLLLTEQQAASLAKNAPSVDLELPGRGSEHGGSFTLTAVPPPGVDMPALPKGEPTPAIPSGLHEIEGRVIAGSMVGLAEQALAERRSVSLENSAPSKDLVPDPSHQPQGAKPAAAPESTPAPSMSM